MKTLISILLATTMLVGCAGQNLDRPNHNKENVGTVVGAGLGALTGAQFGKGKGRLVGMVAGTIAGGVLGNSVGASLDRADAAYYNRSFNNALEYNSTGVQSNWKNPDNGHHGYITPHKTYIRQGKNCREYQQVVMIGGETKKAFGKACRRDDGSWEIMQD